MMASLLKCARNVVADTAAKVAFRVPGLLAAARVGGRAVDSVPGVRTVYRRFGESYARRLKAAGRHHQMVDVGATRFQFDVTDFAAAPWYFYRRPFEPATARVFLEILRAGDTVLDIGANRGFFTLLAAAQVGPTGRVYSFEPNPAVLTDLQVHVRLNGFQDRVICHPDALSDRADDGAVFYVSTKTDNSGLSSLTPTADALARGWLSDANTFRVQTLTLDQWVTNAGLKSPVALVKVDVEGAEALVLAGGKALFADAPPRRLIIETEPEGTAVQLLTGYGYRTSMLDVAGEKCNILFTHPSVE